MPLAAVYWDAAVFHALFAKEAGRHEACEHIVKQAKQGLTIIYTSAITYTECIRIRGKEKLTPDNEGKISAFFLHKFVRPVACDRIIGEQARLLCWNHESLHPKDATHVASALFIPVEMLYTYDEGLLKLSGKIGGPLFKIQMPPAPPQPEQEQRSLFPGQ